MKIFFRILVVFEILGLNILKVQSQNLVPNYSFEDTVAVSSTPAEIDNSLYWVSPTTGTPDYYNSDAGFMTAQGIPNNSFGYQYPHFGNAYGGLYGACQSTMGGPLDCREYVQAQLTQTLIAGHIYNIAFYLNLANYSTVAITEIGAYLSNSAITLGSSSNFPDTPQVLSPSGYFFQDTVAWELVSGNFTASGGEQFITIGNFNDAANTDTINKPPTAVVGTFAYYYIDDVSLSDITGINDFNTDNYFEIFPNPANTTITVKTKIPIQTAFVFDVLGIPVKRVNLSSEKTEIDVANLPNGIYYLHINSIAKKMVVQH